jgi:Flp pilus assembly protein TadG
MTSLHADQRGMVASFLVKVVLGIFLVGLIFVEGGSIMFTELKVRDTAESGANAGVGYLSQTPGQCQGAGQIAGQAVTDKDPDIEIMGMTCLPDGRFRITVPKEASTVVVGRITAIDSWAMAKTTATA